ncbi:hypothetical protein [Paraburkholderia caballeronis]|uniref:Uncharacterized protein n=1 Tax=Paraburkholderia caballeronis TaxID=416943 RepID=A0A1H7IBH3_9BURK|nr:hypothetical protein [Paraburkholderia caballeronis]PXW29170.1 hypothetical protein C7403_10121 [Paraburkholderia caballeronis]PXX04429.1 hypothetical protein C7407_10121 [Paraburkholderia caballeronis]RAK05490.1 hypothetical protein C7409_10121 [Paraburkholderia caballeronis]SEC89402.1 hypothetical protein SAMN05445871_3065 [Paraburkholderia caballeronis]SEK58870.1 hypothetical protein SAMN05192542_102614 [Paraburkholderia caballeronis]
MNSNLRLAPALGPSMPPLRPGFGRLWLPSLLLALLLVAASTACRAQTTMSCRSAAASANPTAGSDTISADTPGSDGTRLFSLGQGVRIDVVTRASRDDKVQWQIDDTWGHAQASGTFAVSQGARTTSLTCSTPRAGYFAFNASLASQPATTLPQRGTRPAGITTFGVLPDVSQTLPPLKYAHADLHRFGGQGTTYIAPGQHCCGGDGYRPLYTDLGLTWINDNRNWYVTEPNAPGQFDPTKNQLAAWLTKGDLLRLILVDGIPAWASPNGKQTHSYAPKSETALRDYMTKVGTESSRVRKTVYPTQAHNYYQVTWEPDPKGGLPWLDTDANFVAMYAAVWEGIHASDPDAIVMGPTYSSVSDNAKYLKRYATLGLARYLDGVTVHGYYDFGNSPSHPPERLGDTPAPNGVVSLPVAMRDLREVMADTMKPGAKLFVTETGITYDIGTSYGPHYPDTQVLYAQSALVARTHLILLGEGADVTFIFYSQDMPQTTAGYGVFFELDHPQGAYGATNVSPKPAALAVAAMTRIVDGSGTLGPLRDTPPGVYAYAFSRPGGKVITALWSHDNAHWNTSTGFDATHSIDWQLQVDARGRSGQVTVFDMMGNPSTMPYRDGMLALGITPSPVYVVSNNVAVVKANATTPAGYVAP